MPDTARANIEQWAATILVPTYAIDDETAIVVVDGRERVVSEGSWERFEPTGAPRSGS
ncbi:MAG: hypothetical protein WC580_04745 [Agrococcus sp.]